MNAISKDRRMFQRLDGIVNVRYTVKGRDKDKNETLPRNIGGGGVGICLPEKLLPGAILELEITAPDNPQNVIRGTGEVQWSKPFGIIEAEQACSLYETGIKFLDIAPLSIDRVYSYFRRMKPISYT